MNAGVIFNNGPHRILSNGVSGNQPLVYTPQVMGPALPVIEVLEPEQPAPSLPPFDFVDGAVDDLSTGPYPRNGHAPTLSLDDDA